MYRIHRACSSWSYFHDSLEKAKRVLERNQYPPAFYEPIIKQTLDAILGADETPPPESPPSNPLKSEKVKLRVQYRGKCTEDYARALHKIQAPCVIVMTLRKLKSVLPSLKPAVEKMIRSGVVYQLQCPRCKACYVGCTTRHLITRSSEHRTQKKKTMAKHLKACNAQITCDDFEILASTSRGQDYLETLEALYIRQINPKINTKDEYRSKELTIKLVP